MYFLCVQVQLEALIQVPLPLLRLPLRIRRDSLEMVCLITAVNCVASEMWKINMGNQEFYYLRNIIQETSLFAMLIFREICNIYLVFIVCLFVYM